MESDILTGRVIGDEAVLSLEDFARACSAEVSWIAELVAMEVLSPEGVEPVNWRFRAADLTCARRVARLQRDFDVNLDAAAVILDLLAQIDRLHTRLLQVGLNPNE